MELTRQQRRALERERNKKVTYNMTVNQAEGIARQTFNDELVKAKDELSKYYTAVVASAFFINLHDNFGFGKKRLQRLLMQIANTMDSVNGGQVELEELVEICKEEFDIDIF